MKRKILFIGFIIVFVGSLTVYYKYLYNSKESKTSIIKVTQKSSNTNIGNTTIDNSSKNNPAISSTNKGTTAKENTLIPKTTTISPSNNLNKPISQQDGEKLASKIAASKYNAATTSYDRDQDQDGKSFYVYRIYNKMDNHIATLAWYYVEKSTGAVYELDIPSNELKLISQ